MLNFRLLKNIANKIITNIMLNKVFRYPLLNATIQKQH